RGQTPFPPQWFMENQTCVGAEKGSGKCEKFGWPAKAPAPPSRRSLTINVGQTLSSVNGAVLAILSHLLVPFSERGSVPVKRGIFLTLIALAVLWAQRHELSARLELTTEPLMPARVYLFKDNHAFRFSPVQALLPLKVDLFYRERL